MFLRYYDVCNDRHGVFKKYIFSVGSKKKIVN